MSMGNAFVPLFARQLGASMGTAAFISSLMFLGQALADLPGGYLVQRFGEKRMMADRQPSHGRGDGFQNCRDEVCCF